MENKESNNLILKAFKSVGAAFFGVQKAENAEEDFSENNFAYYAIVGIILTIVFVFSVILVVQSVLPE